MILHSRRTRMRFWKYPKQTHTVQAEWWLRKLFRGLLRSEWEREDAAAAATGIDRETDNVSVLMRVAFCFALIFGMIHLMGKFSVWIGKIGESWNWTHGACVKKYNDDERRAPLLSFGCTFNFEFSKYLPKKRAHNDCQLQSVCFYFFFYFFCLLVCAFFSWV